MRMATRRQTSPYSPPRIFENKRCVKSARNRSAFLTAIWALQHHEILRHISLYPFELMKARRLPDSSSSIIGQSGRCNPLHAFTNADPKRSLVTGAAARMGLDQSSFTQRRIAPPRTEVRLCGLVDFMEG
jgi:hypothetical protein